jgi:hypothetical protein
MDHGQIECWVALLLPDRRANADSFVPYIEGHTLNRVIINPHLDIMRARAWSLAHFALHGMIAITGEPIDNGADDEVGAEILGEAVEFVNVALSITDMHTPIWLTQQSDRLTEIIEPADTLLCFDWNPRWVDLPLELGGAFELVAVPEFDRGRPRGSPSSVTTRLECISIPHTA